LFAINRASSGGLKKPPGLPEMRIGHLPTSLEFEKSLISASEKEK
jgi:hypothetical protein